jgi:hypothetical protein
MSGSLKKLLFYCQHDCSLSVIYFIYLVTRIPEYSSLQLHVNILHSSEGKKASYCGNQSSHIEEET